MCVSSRSCGQRRRVDREAVVLRGDLDRAGGHVAHRVVRAVVAERHLVGLRAEDDREDLVAEADAEDRLLADQVGDARRSPRVTAAGSPGPFERKIASGSMPSTSSAGVAGGHDGDVEAAVHQAAQDVALGAEVVGDARGCARPLRALRAAGSDAS